MFAEDDVNRRRAEREAADKIYNDALTALDGAVPKLPDLPHPPVAYDETMLHPVNERWSIVQEPPPQPWLRRWIARVVWDLVGPIVERQQSFNAALVDHLNRNVVVHRADRDAIEALIGTLRGELEKLATFHTHLILYLQTITLYVDTKDRSEHVATLVNFVRSGLSSLADEFTQQLERTATRLERDRVRLEQRLGNLAQFVPEVAGVFERRWEALLERDRRQASSLDDLRTAIATVHQTGAALKREMARLLAAGPAARADQPAEPVAAGPVPVPAGLATAQSPVFNSPINAAKYVGFENKFRGSEVDIRQRQLEYAALFDGASDVLDLGCGRGEFLEVLRDRGIAARGLDINHEMVEICRGRGLTVDEGDALVFLAALPDGALGGLVAMQVVEHFAPPYLLQFLEAAYQKLRPGSTMVLETVNAGSWFAFFEAYLRDVTHAWPLHPETLKYLVVASGFQDSQTRYSAPYPDAAKLQHCQLPPGLDSLGVQSFAHVLNENVDKLNALMFGYLDYAIVARRL